MQPDDEYKMIFSKNLNHYLAVNKKKQSDIIADLKINKSAISSWCNGTRLPRMNKIQMLADYLNVNISDLIEENCKKNDYFQYTVEDDAMFPILDIGDTALIHMQKTVENNATYLINLDNTPTIRKIVEANDKNHYTLSAMNHGYKPITIKKEDIKKIKIIGRVIKAENTSAFK